MNDFEQRFGGIARLVGAAGLARLRAAHVCVVGIGGVGAWTVEALARSGVGALTLIDLDEVCVTNINRQIHALDGTVGRAKVEVMAERLKGQLIEQVDRFSKMNMEELLERRYRRLMSHGAQRAR